MTPLDCAALDHAIEPLAAGDPATPEQRAHLDVCASCRARLALAMRLERVLAEWPAASPAAGFARQVAEAARREEWRKEQVVDWGFNAAIAAGLAAIVAGVAAIGWLLGSAAGPADASALMVDAAAAIVTRLRAQAAVTGTATLLLATTLIAWWWAEDRRGW